MDIFQVQRLGPAIEHGRRPIGVSAAQWRSAIAAYKKLHPGFTYLPAPRAPRRKMLSTLNRAGPLPAPRRKGKPLIGASANLPAPRKPRRKGKSR